MTDSVIVIMMTSLVRGQEFSSSLYILHENFANSKVESMRGQLYD